MSSAIDAQPVSVRPRTSCAEMRTCGPWQITNIGFLAWSNSRTNRCTSLLVRMWSGDCPPGTSSASKSSAVTSATSSSAFTLWPSSSPRLPRIFCSARSSTPTIVTIAPASSSARRGSISSDSSNPSPTRAAIRLPSISIRDRAFSPRRRAACRNALALPPPRRGLARARQTVPSVPDRGEEARLGRVRDRGAVEVQVEEAGEQVPRRHVEPPGAVEVREGRDRRALAGLGVRRREQELADAADQLPVHVASPARLALPGPRARPRGQEPAEAADQLPAHFANRAPLAPPGREPRRLVEGFEPSPQQR